MGLSYTTFDYEELRITPEVIAPEESAQVSVTVRNTGPMAGDEVVQLYVTDDIASVVRPGRELKGFARVHLEPGEAREVTFTLDRRPSPVSARTCTTAWNRGRSRCALAVRWRARGRGRCAWGS